MGLAILVALALAAMVEWLVGARKAEQALETAAGVAHGLWCVACLTACGVVGLAVFVWAVRVLSPFAHSL